MGGGGPGNGELSSWLRSGCFIVVSHVHML